jgi:2-polyprenyl-3-methyl-5-hydroxy-6-metoxy-1,4-benzoquinol methylase
MPSTVPVFVSGDFETWESLPRTRITSSYDYRLSISLDPGQVIYVANSLPHRYGAMCSWLKQIQMTYPALSRLASIGKSVLGRDILLLTISETEDKMRNTEKDRILITSGMHPAEPDWLATKAIIEALLSEAPWACDMRQKYTFDIITQLNPDGFVLGTNGCNRNGFNLYWEFHPHAYTRVPETAFLWDWVEAHPPAIYLDFHCYVHHLHKDYQPYLKPIIEYRNPMVRNIVARLDNQLVALSQGRGVRGELTTCRNTLGHHVTAKYDAITYTKYHMHLKHGIERCRNLSVAILRIILDTIEPFRPLKQYQCEITPRQKLRELLHRRFPYGAYQQLKERIPTPVRSALHSVKMHVVQDPYVGRSKVVDQGLGLWPWYEDVCGYFNIPPAEAQRRAIEGEQSKEIWAGKEEIEQSEEAVLKAWSINEDMVIRNCWYRETWSPIDWASLLRQVKYQSGMRVLDYGCGESSFAKWVFYQSQFDTALAAMDITLCEVPGVFLEFCKWRYGNRVSYVSIRPGTRHFNSMGRFGIILCLDVLEHVWSPFQVVQNLYEVLNPGGYLVETYVDDDTGSNLARANRERSAVLKYFDSVMTLISGSFCSDSMRIWHKEVR